MSEPTVEERVTNHLYWRAAKLQVPEITFTINDMIGWLHDNDRPNVPYSTMKRLIERLCQNGKIELVNEKRSAYDAKRFVYHHIKD